MSIFLNDEEVPPMPPLSTAMIENIGEGLLAEIQPEALVEPTKIDFADWADHRLQQYRICVSPASFEEIGARLGATDPTNHGDGFTDILMATDEYDLLFQGGRHAHQARGTLVHEIGHAVLHVPVMRRRIKAGNQELLNRRERRDKLVPFRDPEWQAWALAGCIVAPRRTIVLAGTMAPWELAEIFGVSESFMTSHLRRLRLTPEATS